jgi:hypothetical protein
MKIFLKNQKINFKKHLIDLKKSNILPYKNQELKHKISQRILNSNFPNFPFDLIFNYQIFPSNILSSYSQWIDENRIIQSGDTIVQQINIPPFTCCSQKLIVGVRVKDVFNTNNCKGFSYETLEGHVEKGISIFKIEQVNNLAYFTIETYSSPALPLLKPFQPISSWYQDFCTNKALKNITDLS